VTLRVEQDSPPFLSWYLIVRNAEKTLDTCLRSIRARTPQAEIVIVDTMSSDSSPEIAKRYADVWEQWPGPKGEWTPEMPWFDDAAAARERALGLCSGKYRAWIDADDILVGPEEAERLLKLNGRWCPPADKIIDAATAAPQSLEDILRHAEDKMPEADWFWAPYLYQREPDGTAVVWQSRERIVRWSDPPKYCWAEAAHDVLVPVPGHFAPRIELAHLLFVHERDFSPEAVHWSMSRHWDVLLKQYTRGDITTRRALYLAEYAKTFAPERELEFIEAAHQAGTTPLDRYRSLLQLGIAHGNRGFHWDALEALGAATFMRPDLPDAWVAGGERWAQIDDPIRAADWFARGIALEYNTVESYVRPRDLKVRYPAMLARERSKIAKLFVRAGRHEEALATYRAATETWVKIRDAQEIGPDSFEAQAHLCRAHNDEEAQARVIELDKLAQFLIANDEPAKGLALLRAVPWNLQDHPLVLELERRLAPIARHMTDPGAYAEFYRTVTETGFVSVPEDWLSPDNCIPRARWIAAWINQHKPNAVVYDLGCADGIVGVPLLKLCPGITYVGVDVNHEALEIYKRRLVQFGLQDRASLECGTALPIEVADVLIWSEVIEHVANPVAELEMLRKALRPDGRLFLTTPWGSFDKGHPRPLTDHGTPRDPRGHLRVLTARDMAAVFEARAGTLDIEDLHCSMAPPDRTGDEMRVVARRVESSSLRHPVRFAVQGALWDWNARQSKIGGIGASEGMIIYLAEALAQDRRVEVFGPTPEPDIMQHVRYWPREHLRHVYDGTLIVSRAPSWAKGLDTTTRAPLRKILWLQDAYYPDLNADVAACYDRIVVVSEWHKTAMHELHAVPLDKMDVIYNFVRPECYATWPTQRKRDRFVYASSPDRGAVRCLEIWPRVRAELPEAELHIYYGWKGCERLGLSVDAVWTRRYQSARRAFERLRHQPGVFVHDMIGHDALAAELLQTGVWLHPALDTDGKPFPETCCTLAIEARAAGAIPVCAPYAALAETAASDLTHYIDPRDDVGFAQACISAARTEDDAARQSMSAAALRDFALHAMLPRWKTILR